MYPAVIDVLPKENFLLTVRFDDGTEGLLDMKPYLDFGVFTRIKDPTQFSRVRVSFDTIEWECGVDLDPEFVHTKSKIIQGAQR
jgi:hypothetical protein